MSFFKKLFCIKTIVISLIIIILLSIIAVIFADKIITSKSKNYIYSDVLEIPYNKVGLVLGTSKFLQNGQINLYYKHRIDAAIELYKAGKISYIVVSGDNSRKTYDEPTQMKADLMVGGLPENVIFLDYAGFRTWDSIVRAKEIFSQSEFTIISQRFHNERAVYLAQRYGLNATAFNAKDVSKYYGFKTNLREKLARVKVFVDLLTNKKPRFLGEKIKIENNCDTTCYLQEFTFQELYQIDNLAIGYGYWLNEKFPSFPNITKFNKNIWNEISQESYIFIYNVGKNGYIKINGQFIKLNRIIKSKNNHHLVLAPNDQRMTLYIETKKTLSDENEEDVGHHLDYIEGTITLITGNNKIVKVTKQFYGLVGGGK